MKLGKQGEKRWRDALHSAASVRSTENYSITMSRINIKFNSIPALSACSSQPLPPPVDADQHGSWHNKLTVRGYHYGYASVIENE